MAAIRIVDSPADIASVTIPPPRFKRFQDEVLFDLRSAGDNLAEACKWGADEDKRSDVRMENLIRVTVKELPNVHAVERVWHQVDLVPPTTDTTVTGDRKVLRSTVIGCVLACGADTHGAVESRDTLRAGRAAVEELAFWLDRLEEIGEEPLPDGWHKIEEGE